jgi:ankyrin repeat protein
MSDAIPLPERPNLEQYRKLAKDLQRACNSGDAEAIARISRYRKRDTAARCTLADAQFCLARDHGFASWPKFARHVRALALEQSPVSQFEAASDAIVTGDSAALAALLHNNPGLIRERSLREHRSTLLHCVSANGIEDFRQKTPTNIVEITKMLLSAGAEVNAESDAYGGHSTTLGLTATSCHPEDAGVQIPLMELLIEHGASLDGPGGQSTVNACLHNGRGRAAEFLASRGAKLDLEGAAGIGRLDIVRTFFGQDGALQPPGTQRQVNYGFAWACEFGRTEVAEFLLDKGPEPVHGESGLHWAVYGGHTKIVKMLLERGAAVNLIDDVHHGTPLGWALYAWSNLPVSRDRAPYYEIVALLVRAGAQVDPRLFENVRSDKRMLEALHGHLPGHTLPGRP